MDKSLINHIAVDEINSQIEIYQSKYEREDYDPMLYITMIKIVIHQALYRGLKVDCINDVLSIENIDSKDNILLDLNKIDGVFLNIVKI